MSKDKYPFGLTKEQFDASIQYALEETDRCQAEILGYMKCTYCKKYKQDVSSRQINNQSGYITICDKCSEEFGWSF